MVRYEVYTIANGPMLSVCSSSHATSWQLRFHVFWLIRSEVQTIANRACNVQMILCNLPWVQMWARAIRYIVFTIITGPTLGVVLKYLISRWHTLCVMIDAQSKRDGS